MIFRDDATSDQRRAAACDRLMAMCPGPYRLLMRPYAENALQRVSDAELAALLIDVGYVEQAARRGDLGLIIGIARKYGATDAQVAAFHASTTAPRPADQFADVLPDWR